MGVGGFIEIVYVFFGEEVLVGEWYDVVYDCEFVDICFGGWRYGVYEDDLLYLIWMSVCYVLCDVVFVVVFDDDYFVWGGVDSGDGSCDLVCDIDVC